MFQKEVQNGHLPTAVSTNHPFPSVAVLALSFLATRVNFNLDVLHSLKACYGNGVVTHRPLSCGKMKVKVKFTLEQPKKALRGSRSIALLFL